MQDKDIEIIIGSDNVFEDIGLPRPKETLAKAKLLLHVGTAMKSRGLKRKDAAKLLHMSPKKFSSVMDGESLDEVTIGQLVDYLAALNVYVEVNVHHQLDAL